MSSREEPESMNDNSLPEKVDKETQGDESLERDYHPKHHAQVMLPNSRETSVSPQHEENGSTSIMAASTLVMHGTQSHERRQKSKSEDRGPYCCSPRDRGRHTSLLYFILLVVIGTILPITESLQNAWLIDLPIAVFLAYLYGVSIIFILFVEIYLLRRAKRRNEERRLKRLEPQDQTIHDEDKSFDSTGKSNLAYTSQQSITHPNGKGRAMSDYDDMDNKSTKSETSNVTELFMGNPDPELDEPLPNRISLFHRIAIAVFALGLMIYTGLLLKQLHERHSPAACNVTNMIWPHYIQLAFLLIQTFFIFKHSQIALRCWQPFFRLGLLHLVATNWTILIRSVIRETLDAYLSNQIFLYKNQVGDVSHVSSFAACYDEDDILYKASPYLYSFILQYSVLAMAASLALYLDIGYIPQSEETEKTEDDTSVSEKKRMSRSYSQTAVNAVNFHKTHQGLFAGLVVTAATFVSIILFFSYMENDPAIESTITVMIYYISDMALNVVIAIVVTIGWFRISKLAFVWPPEGVAIDEVLIIISMSGSIFYRLFKTVSTVKTLIAGNVTSNVILTLCDMIISNGLNLYQTGFLLDCFGRRSTTKRHLKEKPARGSVTFLMVANLALWAFRMFQLKEAQVEGLSSDQATYGFLAWQIVLRLFVPFSIFYHYQASASFARIWTDAYRKETVKETLRRQAEEQEEALRKSKSLDLQFFPTKPSPIMRVIELRRRFRRREEQENEPESVWSPVSDV